MEEAPTISQNDKSIEKIIQVIQENKKTCFSFKIKENNLIISTEINDSFISHFYYSTVSIQDIQKNRYFLQFDTIEEILNELILKSQTKAPIFEKDNNNIILKISLNSFKYKDIEFTLKEKNKTSDDKFKELYDIVFELKKEINNLKKENNQLKEQIEILNDFKNKIEEEKMQKEKIEKEKIEKLFSNSSILNNYQ